MFHIFIFHCCIFIILIYVKKVATPNFGVANVK